VTGEWLRRSTGDDDDDDDDDVRLSKPFSAGVLKVCPFLNG
jgi:hypothetical protein